MIIPVFTHPDCIRHDSGPDHPETPARLTAVLARLAMLPEAEVREAPVGNREDLLRVHPDGHLIRLEAMSRVGGGALSLDTVASGESWAAVLGATGALSAAVDHAHRSGGHAFAAIRPPGHHALAQRAMGFCLVNNVMVGAREAQRLGRERVLIVDWDVHHGNGTQALMERDASMRFVSLHQHPWYPGTGLAEERGVGNVFNVPRGPGAPAAMYVDDLWGAIVAATEGWPPGMVFISAGYDAMYGDPLGGFTLEPRDFARLVTRLRERMPGTPIVALLEGGYVPARVAEGVAATVQALA
jgi:acetoin utilization deacetylase AcuC-like enzyme